MPDIFKTFIKHMNGVQKAAVADAAAQAMAENCDKRIDKARMLLTKIVEHAQDGRIGSASYTMDRLIQIQKVAELGLRRL